MIQAFYLLFSCYSVYLLFSYVNRLTVCVCMSCVSCESFVCISRVFCGVVISSMVSMDRSFIIVRGYVMQVITEFL